MAVPLPVPLSPHLEGHVEGFGGTLARGPLCTVRACPYFTKGFGGTSPSSMFLCKLCALVYTVHYTVQS